MIEWPMHQLLTVKNLPPPLFSEGNFITVHRCSLKFNAQDELASEGNEVKEHTDPDSVDYI